MSCGLWVNLKMEEDEDEPLDPFVCLHEYIHELVIQHLSGSEVLEASKVCQNWHSLLGSSRKAMEKIFFDCSSEQVIVNVLVQSSRKYQNFTHLRSVTGSTLKTFIRKFYESVAMICDSRDFVVEGFELRRLEVLDVSCAYDLGLVTASPKLKVLRMRSFSTDLPTFDQIISKSRLEELQVGLHGIDSWFKNPLPPIPSDFKLKKLKIRDHISRSPAIEENFTRFLATQDNYLNSISIEGCGFQKIAQWIVANMKALKTFKVNTEFAGREIAFATNSSITKLDIRNSFHGRIEFAVIKSIVPALPNLEVLTTDIEYMSKDKLAFLVTNAPKLWKLKSFFPEDFLSFMEEYLMSTFGEVTLSIVAMPVNEPIYQNLLEARSSRRFLARDQSAFWSQRKRRCCIQ